MRNEEGGGPRTTGPRDYETAGKKQRAESRNLFEHPGPLAGGFSALPRRSQAEADQRSKLDVGCWMFPLFPPLSGSLSGETTRIR